MPSSGHHTLGLWLAPLLALGALVGCTADQGSADPSEPSLTVVGSNICGRNMLPETSVENFQEGKWISLDLVATGIDPFTASREMVDGTQVEFYIDEESTTGRAFFVSTSDDDYVSAPRPMIGRTARTQIFCVGRGDIYVGARITGYQAAGEEPAADVTSIRPFPIRCVDELSYSETCGPVDFGMAEPPSDAGPVDMEVPDAGDMGEPDALIQTPWTVRFVPPDDVAELVMSIRGSAGTRPDNIVLNFNVLEGENPLQDVPVLFELTGIDSNNNGWPGGVLLRAEPEALNERARLAGEAEPLDPADADDYAAYRVGYQDLFGGDLAVDEASQVAFTDASGQARVRVIAGGVPGTLSIRAVGFRQGNVDWDQSRPLVIRGGIPSHRGFDLDCEHSIIPGFTQREVDIDLPDNRREGQTRYLLSNEAGTLCRVQVADRINGRIDREHRVYFMTEAGTVNQESGLDEEGGASTELRVGDPPPRDVEPDDWEERYARDVDDVILNPRDGLVRVVAFTRGEEDFNDTNGDKVFTRGIDVQEPGMMLSEPYIDANDNGTRDANEEFRDTDGNGQWYTPIPAAHTWRSSTDIWTSTTVLWTGDLRVDLESGPQIAVCEAADGCYPPGPGGPEACQFSFAPINFDLGGQMVLEAEFIDDNGNCLGGRGEGQVSLSLGTDLGTSEFLVRTIGGQYCWEGFEKPRGKKFVWPIFNSTTDNTAEVGVHLTYQTVGETQRSISWTFPVCR